MSNKITYKWEDTCFYDAISAKWFQLDCLEISGGLITNINFTECVVGKMYSRYILPGFIDAHCHILENPNDNSIDSLASIAFENALTASRGGITALKDMGGFFFKAIEIVNRLNNYKLPRIFTSGCYFTSPEGHCSDHGAIIISDIERFKREIGRLLKNNVYFCKIIHGDEGFPLKLLKEMINFAHSKGMMVSCHAYTEKAASEAVLAGTDTLEHAGDYSDKLLEQIKMNNVIIVPTYVAAVDSTPANCEALNDVSEDILKTWVLGENKVIPKLFQNDLLVALGTDSGFLGTPCDSLIREIKLLKSNFNIPIERIMFSALVTTPMTVMMGDMLGKIAQGYYADFTCYYNNPIANLDLLGHPDEVWIHGERTDNMIANCVTIRRLSICDVEVVSSYLRHYYFDCGTIDDFWNENELKAWISDHSDYCIGAFLDDILIGFCLTHYHKAVNKVHLENIFIVEKYRRNGVAHRLLYDVVSYYANNSKTIRFIGMVDFDNIKSQKLLETFYFIKGRPMFWMQRNIKDEL